MIKINFVYIFIGDEDDEEEDEDDDYENVEDEESDSANEENDTTVTILEKKNYQSPMLKASPGEYFSNPSPISLIALHKAKEDLLSVLPKEPTVDDYLKLFVKICSVVKPEDKDVKLAACSYADDILPKAVESSSIPIFNDKLLVHLGLLKGEDMKHPVGMDITGALSVLQHCVKQSYFDDTTRSLLKFFLSRPLNVSACEKTKHGLMQILYQI